MHLLQVSPSLIGTVGTTGNAAGKPPHIQDSIMTAIPYVWQIDSDYHDWLKMLYLNPISNVFRRLRNSIVAYLANNLNLILISTKYLIESKSFPLKICTLPQ